MKRPIIFIVFVPLLYAIYLGVMVANQAIILFPAASLHHHVFAATLPPTSQLVELPVSFGKARAVYWRPQTAIGPVPAIWFAHGNYETVEDSFQLVQPLLAQGFAVMQLEYPGYDGADGSPTFASVTEAADASWNWLAQQDNIDKTRMVAMGYSMGGGVAAALTERHDVAALVLLSTYSSITDVARRYAVPASLVAFPYDNIARVRQFCGPVFIEHGRRDEVIPFSLGERLLAASPRAEFLPLNCGHADCHFDKTVFSHQLPEWIRAKQRAEPSSKADACSQGAGLAHHGNQSTGVLRFSRK